MLNVHKTKSSNNNNNNVVPYLYKKYIIHLEIFRRLRLFNNLMDCTWKKKKTITVMNTNTRVFG